MHQSMKKSTGTPVKKVLVPYFSRYLKKLFGAGTGAGAGDAIRICSSAILVSNV
jgi:hypothetical protein